VYFFFFLQLAYPFSACVMFYCGVFRFAMITNLGVSRCENF